MTIHKSIKIIFLGICIALALPGAKVQAQEFACMDCKGSLFANGRDCYCGTDAEKVINCLQQKYPKYPFLNGGPADVAQVNCSNTLDQATLDNCRSSLDNIALVNSTNAGPDISRCISSVGVKPTYTMTKDLPTTYTEVTTTTRRSSGLKTSTMMPWTLVSALGWIIIL
jgi:hypothetical protein